MSQKRSKSRKPPPYDAPESVAARQREYKSRRRKMGEMRVSVWVPCERAEEMRGLAAKWRREAEQEAGGKRPTPAEPPSPFGSPPGYEWLEDFETSDDT